MLKNQSPFFILYTFKFLDYMFGVGLIFFFSNKNKYRSLIYKNKFSLFNFFFYSFLGVLLFYEINLYYTIEWNKIILSFKFLSNEKKKCFSIFFEERICFSLIFAVLLGTFTFFLDPGIIPKSRLKKYNEIKRYSDFFIKSKFFFINNIHDYNIKYCHFCKIWRTKKCSHCWSCNCCVERFDHHCPWIKNCIGLRNYKIYLIFVFSVSFSLFINNFSFFWNFYEQKMAFLCSKSNTHKIYTKSAAFFNIFINLSGFIFTGILICCHFYFYIIGMTTFEFIKNPKKKISFVKILKITIKNIHDRNKQSLITNNFIDQKKFFFSIKKISYLNKIKMKKFF